MIRVIRGRNILPPIARRQFKIESAGPLVAGRWLLVPLLKGEPLFAGFNSNTMLVQAIIIPLFGAGLAWFYGRLSGAGQA